MNATAQPLRTWPVDELVHHLQGRGVDLAGAVRSTVLTGGVSGTVVRLDAEPDGVVVKQALAELAVPLEWHADPRRLLTEAAALRVLHALSPGHVPAVRDVDEERLLLTMAAAPATWTTWKERLLAADGPAAAADLSLAEQLGAVLRRWHDATRADAWTDDLGPRERFAPRTDFADLRLDPFYRHVARTLGGPVAAALSDLADALASCSECLVHGDVSPKNVLTAPAADGWWLLDAECAVLGDPVFDVAFVLAHLLLKSLEPTRSHAADAARRLWTAYAASRPPFPEAHLTAHTAALMLARVAGVSQVDYLTDAQRERVRRVATAAVVHPPATLADLVTALVPAQEPS